MHVGTFAPMMEYTSAPMLGWGYPPRYESRKADPKYYIYSYINAQLLLKYPVIQIVFML